MRILAVDTASGSGSVAVADGDHLLAEVATARRETHSRYLMSLIDRALRLSGLELQEIDGFAVTRGPGSFTGLRIGISTVKGLAWVTGKPAVGVSSLEALAVQASATSGLICSLLDARNHEVYCGRYRFMAGRLNCELGEEAASPEAAIAGIDEPCLFIGDGALRYREMITHQLGERASFAVSFQHPLRAAAILHLSQLKFSENRADTAAALLPRYLRKSYAELK
ncbi:MAG: tRNA (adenosine(37)-N6)-threonylcarbamoyltransferase complex dimerization subunit type 1 TsaB [Pseudomonadota bacterium]